MDAITQALGPDGAIARTLPDFTAREQQIAMAQAIAETLSEQGQLVTEAGTGTGKTYAYLVPALLHGGKIILSTGTKTLQDQLYYRDLPTIQKALQTHATTALLKGRANYLCHYRLEQTELAGRLDSSHLHQLNLLRDWRASTETGDIAQCSEVPENAPIWPQVTSTVDNCLGSECPRYSDCYVVKARRAAQEADIVVINHHLFFIDLALKEEGFGEILPSADAVIFDEAHQIPDIARQYFGESVSSRQISELLKDVEQERQAHAGEELSLREASQMVETELHRVQAGLGRGGQRAAWQARLDKASTQSAVTKLSDSLDEYSKILENVHGRSPGLERGLQRAVDLKFKLQTFLQGQASLPAPLDEETAERLTEHWVYWFETFEKRFVFHRTPVLVADTFKSHLELTHCAWVFTSATLSVGQRFEHFNRELGLTQARTERWDSPFRYDLQSLLYVPNGLPQPNSPDYVASVVEAALPLLESVGGRAFFLLTSYDALHQAHRLIQNLTDHPILVQGELPKATLLSRFRELGNAILLGTYSFWEGVDVKGSALSCVIIDKLPFASPGDPVMQAQLTAIADQGGNPFMQLQIPQAVIRLKQGVGRLIRDEQDTGVLMIADPRLYNKGYGRLFLRSLPPMPVTREWTQVQAFIEQNL